MKTNKTKGQATIEFIFIILIVVIYIFGVTKPIIENTQGVIEDIENISKTNYATQQIINTTNKLALLGSGSKESITTFIPKNSKIICDNQKIYFETQINQTGNNPELSVCKENNCIKEFNPINGIDLDCTATIFNYGIRTITIEKIESNKIKIYEK